jgi:Fic family protein
MSIHASTAIEGNRLTLGQVTNVINGIPVWGPQKDIKEVQNAWQAYNELAQFDPWDTTDLLKAHALMTDELIGESGSFRTVNVAVVRGDGAIMHRGADPAEVPNLVKELLEWGCESKAHPLIKSSAVHFMVEHIHPFRDGNGRVGRLWQTLVLSKWNPLFAWMPVETLVHYNQALYYKALQDSHRNEVDCRPFIDFMLDAIENSLHKYVDIASSAEVLPDTVADVGVNVGVNVGVKFDIVSKLKVQPALTAQELAAMLNRSPRTIERYIKELRERGVLVRAGSDKSGYWQVQEEGAAPLSPRKLHL